MKRLLTTVRQWPDSNGHTQQIKGCRDTEAQQALSAVQQVPTMEYILCPPEGDANGVEAVQLGAVHEGGEVALLGRLASPQAPKPCGAILKAIPRESLRHHCLLNNSMTGKAQSCPAMPALMLFSADCPLASPQAFALLPPTA